MDLATLTAADVVRLTGFRIKAASEQAQAFEPGGKAPVTPPATPPATPPSAKAPDPDAIQIPGIRPGRTPYPHQVRALEKLIAANGTMVLAHGTGSGKCLRAGTPVLTNRGLVPIESLFPLGECDGERTLPPPEGLKVIGLAETGRLIEIPVLGLFQQRLPSEERTVLLRTERGVEYDVTGVHPLPALQDGAVVWKSACLWSEGDRVAVPRQLPSFENAVVPDDLVTLLAWQVTEGCEARCKNTVRVTNNDELVLGLVQRLARALGLSAKICRPKARGKARSPYVYWCSKRYRQELEGHGYTWNQKSAGKAFPPQFMNLPRRQARMLLTSVFEAEGYIGTGVELTTASKVLANQLVYLLAQFGIRPSLNEKWGSATNGKRIRRKYYRLYFSGEGLRTFYSEIGFLSERKQTDLKRAATASEGAWSKYGAPVQDVLLALQSMGLGYALQGTRKASSQVMGDSGLAQVSAALTEGPRLKDDYRGGIAKQWRERTRSASLKHAAAMGLYAQRLAWLSVGPIGFDKVVSVEPGEAGGMVYDLILPEPHNFVAGMGCGLVHNTATSIMAEKVLKAMGRSSSALVVVPAGLRENYADAVREFTSGASVQVIGPKGERGSRYVSDALPGQEFTVISYELFEQNPELVAKLKPDTLIVDEFHRVRNPSGSTYDAIMRVRPYVKNFIGLTASPVNNDPADVAPLMSLALGRQFMTKSQFKNRFERRMAREAGFFGGSKFLMGMQNVQGLQKEIGPYIDIMTSEQAAGDKMPKKNVEYVDVPMSRDQEERYRYVLKQLNPVTAWSIAHDVPLSDDQISMAFQQMLRARQASNSMAAVDSDMPLATAAEQTPKIRRVLDDLSGHLKTTPDGQVIVFSNLIHGGVDVVAAGLQRRGIPFGLFIGKGKDVVGIKSTDAERNKAVDDFRAGKTKVLVLSGAGAEGLDLPNTTMVQMVDGHFNPERVLQAEARGRRLGGLSARPPEQRIVDVRRYRSTIAPDIWDRMSGKRETSIDQYIYQIAGRKAQANRQFWDALMSAPARPLPNLRQVLQTARPAQVTSTATPMVPVVAAQQPPGTVLPKGDPMAKYMRRFRKPDGSIVYQYAPQPGVM